MSLQELINGKWSGEDAGDPAHDASPRGVVVAACAAVALCSIAAAWFFADKGMAAPAATASCVAVLSEIAAVWNSIG